MEIIMLPPHFNAPIKKQANWNMTNFENNLNKIWRWNWFSIAGQSSSTRGWRRTRTETEIVKQRNLRKSEETNQIGEGIVRTSLRYNHSGWIWQILSDPEEGGQLWSSLYKSWSGRRRRVPVSTKKDSKISVST